MKRTEQVIFGLLLLLLLLRSLHAEAPVAPYHPTRVLLTPKPGHAAEAADQHRAKGRSIHKQFPGINDLQVVEIAPGEDVPSVVKEYKASGAFDVVEPDYLLGINVSPSDLYFNAGFQWYLHNEQLANGLEADIHAQAGWDIRHDATNIIVAIVDSGVRQAHEDLAPNLWVNSREIPGNGIDDDGDGYIDDVHGINSITGTGNPEDDVGHGTHVAGIIGAAGNNSKGITGIAWNVQIMPLKFITADGYGDTANAIECINYAIAHGAKVINASFSSTNSSSSLSAAITSARNAGVIFVAAAGNDSLNIDSKPAYPASYTQDNIVSVCATTQADTFETLYSNYGATSVDIGAPGTYLYSTYIDSTGYTYLSGTSMATPVVVGVVALMRAQFPNDTYQQIIQRLYASVDKLPSLAGKCTTGGRVNLEKALSPFVSAAFTPSALAGAFPMSVRFTNQSWGDISGYLWDFGDGSATSTEANPTHSFDNEGSFTVKLTTFGSGGVQSTKTQTISAVSGYSFKAATYEWIDPVAAGMISIPLADNAVSAAQDIGFDFDFYGQTKTQIYVGSNGLLGFDTANITTTSNADLPTANTPNGIICPYWDNLNPATAGAVYAGTIGVAPNRRFVASWVGVARNSSSDRMTFQAVLSETTGFIQFNYKEVNPTSARGGGARASIGIEDSSGTLATKYGFDGTPNRVTNSQSVIFLPSAVRGETKFAAPEFVNGDVQLNFAAYVGETYVIEASSDLSTWVEVQRGTVSGAGSVSITEAASANASRFFRASILR